MAVLCIDEMEGLYFIINKGVQEMANKKAEEKKLWIKNSITALQIKIIEVYTIHILYSMLILTLFIVCICMRKKILSGKEIECVRFRYCTEW